MDNVAVEKCPEAEGLLETFSQTMIVITDEIRRRAYSFFETLAWASCLRTFG
jgi:hypothetical protein